VRIRGAIIAVLGLLPLAWPASCVHGASPVAGHTPPVASSADPTLSTVSWDYHPGQPHRLRARLDLGPGIRLFVGDYGERWLVDARAGHAEAASMLADEDLVAVAQPSPDAFAFIGARGTIYRAGTPLGPLVSQARPDPAVWGATAAGKLILGMRYDGTAVRSDDGGRTFTPVAGVSARVVAAQVAADGRAMLLGSPESLWLSKDGGATFARADGEPVGAAEVMLEAGGALVARGYENSIIWETGGEPVSRKVDFSIEPPAMDLLTDVTPGPSAQAVTEGRAAIVGTRYYEAVPPSRNQRVWELASGGLSGRTRRTPIPGSSDCRRMRVTGGGSTIALVCTSRSTKEDSVLFPALRLLVSRDAGATFESVSTGLVADEEDTHVTVTSRGTLLVTGACKPQPRGLCAPGAPLRLVPSPGSKRLRIGTWEPSNLPPILGRPGRIVAAPNRQRLYSTAVLLPERRPAVLLSDDDGATFRAVAIDLPGATADAGFDGGVAAAATIVGIGSDGLSVDATGRLSVVAATGAGIAWVVLDSDGRLLSSRVIAPEYQRLSAVGARGLAITQEDGRIFESTDGGATFQLAGRLPKHETASSTVPAVVCVDQGCLVGESFSRLGWGRGVGEALESTAATSPSPTHRPTPIVCDVVEASGADVPGADINVDAFDADRGDVAWSTFIMDRARAAVDVLHASMSSPDAVQRMTLLEPGTGEGSACAVRNQAEGIAALRYRHDKDPAGGVRPGRMRQIEIAWDHQLKGKIFHATIRDGGPMQPRDISDTRRGEASMANAQMLSVADDGVFLCPHATCGENARDALLVDERGRVRNVRLPDPPSRGYGDRPVPHRDYVVRSGGNDVFLSVILDGGAVLRKRPAAGDRWTTEALALLPTTALADGFRGTLTWAFQGDSLAGMVFTATHPSQPGFAQLLRLDTPSGVAAPSDAPTQSDLGDPPRACTAADRKGSLRIIVPSQHDTRHPIVVRGDRNAVYVLLSDYAVIYGPKGSACLSMYDTIASSTTPGNVSALINAGNLDRSWLFMPAPAGGLRWRSMRCRFEPGATVPAPRPPDPEPPRPAPSSSSIPGASVRGPAPVVPRVVPRPSSSAPAPRPPPTRRIQ
jgi:hypothetical protein